jgi:ribose/xylose/arabinose/galactoside ABC-type transport system permease subunit
MLEFSFLGSTDPNAGQNLLFPAFAAVIVGGTSLNGGVGTIGGTVIGAVLLSILDNGLSLIGVGSYTQLIFIGGITITAVALDRWTTSRHQPGVYRA